MPGRSRKPAPAVLFPKPPDPTPSPNAASKAKRNGRASIGSRRPSNRSPLPPTQPEVEAENAEVDVQETSQMWILRHLRLYLEDVHDAVLTNFVYQQDVTPFRNFMMDSNERRVLFVLVRHHTVQLLAPPAPAAHLDEPRLSSRPPTPKAPKTPKTPKAPKTTAKPTAKTATKSAKKKSKSRSRSTPVKESRKTPEAPPDVNGKETLMAEMETHDAMDNLVSLKWYTNRRLPDETDNFVYVVSRERERPQERSELDQSYFVGHCRQLHRVKQAIDIAAQILGAKMTFERQMDMLMYATAPPTQRERWQSASERFENFITDSISHAFWKSGVTGREDSVLSLGDQRTAVESVESLLRPQIDAFVKEPNTTTRVQLWLQLSLYELKFVRPEDAGEVTGNRLDRILTLFQTLLLLEHGKGAGTTTPWLQKTFFYTVELTARVLGADLMRAVSELAIDVFAPPPSPTAQRSTVRPLVKPVFGQMLALGTESVFPAKQAEHGVLESMKQCLTVFEYIEEELEKVAGLVEFLRSPAHDMLVDRTPLETAFRILQSVMEMFQETYFESALESGNMETMKTICLQLSNQRESLRVLVDRLAPSGNAPPT